VLQSGLLGLDRPRLEAASIFLLEGVMDKLLRLGVAHIWLELLKVDDGLGLGEPIIGMVSIVVVLIRNLQFSTNTLVSLLGAEPSLP